MTATAPSRVIASTPLRMLDDHVPEERVVGSPDVVVTASNPATPCSDGRSCAPVTGAIATNWAWRQRRRLVQKMPGRTVW